MLIPNLIALNSHPMKNVFLFLFTFYFCMSCTQQQNNQDEELTTEEIIDTPQFQPDSTQYCENQYYNQAFQEMKYMLDGELPLDFKRAAFLIEWAYSEGKLDYNEFCFQITDLTTKIQQFIRQKGVQAYKTAPNYALFEFFTKPYSMNGNQPYTYDFEDFYGDKDYRSVFVTKLLETHKGQCRSLPMLYKILCDELQGESFLAMGPNHMYIKHLDEKGKWVNIELTNSNFSTDAWMISSMDISAESIRNGVYMKELSLRESVAYCVSSLASTYEHQYGYDDFVILCSDLTLKYYPTCIIALMNKANTYSTCGQNYIKNMVRNERLFWKKIMLNTKRPKPKWNN